MKTYHHLLPWRRLCGTARPFWRAACVLSLWLAMLPGSKGQPRPHYFDGIDVAPDRTVTLSLNGGISNLIPGLSGTILNQFNQMFDLYVVDASTNLNATTFIQYNNYTEQVNVNFRIQPVAVNMFGEDNVPCLSHDIQVG